jgi:hypothetical protein
MREVFVTDNVWDKIGDLENYLIDELKLSERAALRRTNRMRAYVKKLGVELRYPLCRFRQWRIRGYRCALFEKTWVFAYEEFDDGIILRDMSHVSLLKE